MIYAIIICNFLQVVFEASMLYALEKTFKPTYLDRLENPMNLDDETTE